jgi:peptidoglycan/xylan/chitin deacetylase (PgdA/CDA1 family)
LDVLDRYHVLATFFVVGVHVPGGADVVARAFEAGHSVQNHTWSHPSLTRLSLSAVADQLTRTSAAITAITGTAPSCYRPPGGSTSHRVRAVGSSLGLAEVRWNVDPADYRRPSPAAIAQRVLAAADGRPLVVLLHDGGGDRRNTVAALPAIIEGLRARGYEFVPLCA